MIYQDIHNYDNHNYDRYNNPTNITGTHGTRNSEISRRKNLWLPAIWSPGMERDQSPASAAPEASDPVVPHVKCLLGLLYLYHSCGYHGR